MRIEADGLLLRSLEVADAPVVVEHFQDPAARAFTAYDTPSPFLLPHAEHWIAGLAEKEAAGTSLACAVVEDGTVLGSVELRSWDGDAGRKGEVGYWTLHAATGRGIATRATRLLARWAFEQGYVRLELTAHPENGASQRVALGSGFRREGLLRGTALGPDGREDRVLYGRLASDPDEPTPRLLPDLRDPLTDGVVEVRPQRAADAESQLSSLRDPEFVRWLPASVQVVPDLAVIRRKIARQDDDWLAGRQAACSVVDLAGDQTVGEVTLRMTEPAIGTVQMGWSTAPEHRGHGYASRGVRLLARWAFDVLGMERLEAPAGTDNIASLAVGAAVGFAQEGVLRGGMVGPEGPYDLMMQALLPADLR